MFWGKRISAKIKLFIIGVFSKPKAPEICSAIPINGEPGKYKLFLDYKFAKAYKRDIAVALVVKGYDLVDEVVDENILMVSFIVVPIKSPFNNSMYLQASDIIKIVNSVV